MSPSIASSIGSQQYPALLMLLAGLALTGYGGYDYLQQSDTLEEAVEVNATVTETRIETNQGRRSVDYEPTIAFDYRFRGQSYTSNRRFPTSSSPNYDTKSAAREVLEEYDVDESVTAYVNPSSPGDAFLEHEKSEYPLKVAGIGGLLALVAGGHIVRTSRSG